MDPADLPRLQGPLEGADVRGGRLAIAACRPSPPPVALGRLEPARVPAGGYPCAGVNCAFKLFRRHALDGIRLDAAGVTVSVERLARIARRGHRIVQVPVAHFPRPAGSPSGGRPDVIVRALVELTRLRRRFLAERRETALTLRPARAASTTGGG
jgi:hypothetical protein